MKPLKAIIISIVFCLVVALINKTTNAQTTCPTPPTDSGSALSTVTITTTATYTIWSRNLAPDTTNNSYYLQIDNNCAIKVGDVAIPANTWTWVNYQDGNTGNVITTQLTAGEHVVKLIGNEPNVGVDKLIFLREVCTPIGTGDNCTILPTATNVPLTPTNTPAPTPTAILTPTKTPTPTVSTEITPPAISIISPVNGSIVNRKSTIEIAATASDASGIARVDFYVNSILRCSETAPPYNCLFKTSNQKGATFSILVKAYDTKGNYATTTASISNF